MNKVLTSAVIERVKKSFERKAERERVYVTSDGQVFGAENDADGQAANLKKAGKGGEVITVSRSSMMAATVPGAPEPQPEAIPAVEKAAALTPLQIAESMAANAAANAADAKKQLDAAKAKVADVKAEHAALPADAHTNKVNAVAAKIKKAEAQVLTLTEALAVAEAQAAEAAAKVAALIAEAPATEVAEPAKEAPAAE